MFGRVPFVCPQALLTIVLGFWFTHSAFVGLIPIDKDVEEHKAKTKAKGGANSDKKAKKSQVAPTPVEVTEAPEESKSL